MNTLSNIVAKINMLPALVRSRALTTFFGRTVKFVGTAGVTVESLTESSCTVSLRNRKKVQNHIGSVHAVANALLAETATGFVVGMNVPDDAVPVIKTMHLEYVKRSNGDMRAVAMLTDEQVKQIQSEEKGEVKVRVVITDEDNKEPVEAEMTWAWTPKRRKSASPKAA